jgi:hypothetical protein
VTYSFDEFSVRAEFSGEQERAALAIWISFLADDSV